MGGEFVKVAGSVIIIIIIILIILIIIIRIITPFSGLNGEVYEVRERFLGLGTRETVI